MTIQFFQYCLLKILSFLHWVACVRMVPLFKLDCMLLLFSLFNSSNSVTNQSLDLLFSCSVVSDFLHSCGLKHVRFPCPSPSLRTCLNACPLSQWCHPTILPSVIPLSSCLQSFPASGSFSMSQFLISHGQSIGASASILPMNIQGWFPLGLTGLVSLQSKGLSTVFSNTTVQKHQFFSAQFSLWSNSHSHTWLL